MQSIRSTTRRVDAGAEFINGASPADEFYTLFSGWAIRCRGLEDGRTQILSLFLPGSFIDSRFETENGPSYWTEAVTDVSLCVFPAQALEEATKVHPTLMQSMATLAREEEGLLLERLTDLGRRHAFERVAHFLLEVYTRLELGGEIRDHSCAFPLRQRHLADALGLSVEHVNRILGELRERQLASIHRRTLTIHDVDRLASACDFERGYIQARPLF